jgi:hypothetical protein
MYVAAGPSQGVGAQGTGFGATNGYSTGHTSSSSGSSLSGLNINGNGIRHSIGEANGTPAWSMLEHQPVDGWDSMSGSVDSAPLDQVLSVLKSARRGLIVLGELPAPEDGMAAAAVATALGWPVVADVLSGLRLHRGGTGTSSTATVSSSTTPTVGSSTGPISSTSNGAVQPPAAGSASGTGTGLSIIHSMDHILLGDTSWWGQLRPDVILQLGPRLTSKRVTQFLVRLLAGGVHGRQGVGHKEWPQRALGQEGISLHLSQPNKFTHV